MVKIVSQQDRNLLSKVVSLYKSMTVDGDESAAVKIKELGKKSINQEFSIAFCGHFSAGKSSMINRLIGDPILPSSPIPTSANLVKLVNGPEYAKVYYKQGGSTLYPAPYDYEIVKRYCKDGDEIQSIEISHGGSPFLKNMVVMDTPGIDSTDDAHRISAESALHLADLVLYVMDYNHVQSEVNFLFTKDLVDAGKELYLVINQIDKHQETELSFEQFKESVSSSFESWGVKPSGIFYTTLKDENSPQNQFQELQQFLIGRKENQKEILPQSIHNSLEMILEDHLDFLFRKIEKRHTELEEVLSEISANERENLASILNKTQIERENLFSEDSVEKEFNSGIENILENAYIMPFQTRELAERYLQSCQPEFKVGLLFTKQKTQMEREERLEKFQHDLEEKVRSQLEWHIKDFLLSWLKKHQVTTSEINDEVQEFHILFTRELLEGSVKSGARLSGEYVLNYTKDVTESLKKMIRNQMEPLKELILKEIHTLHQEKLTEMKDREAKLEILSSAWNELKTLEHGIEEKRRKLTELIYGNEWLEICEEDVAELLYEDKGVEVASISDPIIKSVENEHTDTDKISFNKDGTVDHDLDGYHVKLDRLLKKLHFTAEQIQDIPGLRKVAKELKRKSDSLEDREFTVALFGAFSAGKSSFANALIGEKLLPVSPNPTTAAINRIKPINEQHSHGNVVIKIKSSESLLEEVNRSLKLFGKFATDVKDSIIVIQGINWEENEYNAIEKTHYSFLKAFVNGFDELNEHFGNELKKGLDSFSCYVAEEEKSCFVEWIDVYYDCPLTKEGITLVDTPGADSIHARHTGVAFDYIKNSDVVLFVTYYNHAFSKADREFLIQLGRVKDTFELDKMFFVVNAVDLANSKEEQEMVMEYIKEQLIQYGIRNPNLYPVSSLNGLKSKKSSEKKPEPFLHHFEKEFFSFISNGLMDMAMKSAEFTWNQALAMMQELIHSSIEDQEGKVLRKNKLLNEMEQMIQLLSNKTSKGIHKKTSQEINELLYYILQRVFLRFGEFFREAFNPAVLKGDGRKMKLALDKALNELLESIGFDLAQELRATTLRIESFIYRNLNDLQSVLVDELKKIHPSISLNLKEMEPMDVLEFELAFKNTNRSRFSKAMGFFKNSKSFFEKNEKKLMMEELEPELKSLAEVYLEEEKNKLDHHYFTEVDRAFKRIMFDYEDQVKEYFEGIITFMDDEQLVDKMEDALEKITLFGD